jgi:hypothetical protein
MVLFQLPVQRQHFQLISGTPRTSKNPEKGRLRRGHGGIFLYHHRMYGRKSPTCAAPPAIWWNGRVVKTVDGTNTEELTPNIFLVAQKFTLPRRAQGS